MQLHTFIADSAADAVRQIRAELGPQAVVLNVRPLPAEGLSRLWQKPRIEVLAHVPEENVLSASSNAETASEGRTGYSAVGEQDGLVSSSKDIVPPVPSRHYSRAENSVREESGHRVVVPGATTGARPLAQPLFEATTRAPMASSSGWRVREFLEKGGLLPINAQRVVEELRNLHGDQPPLALGAELQLTQEVLRDLWHGLKRPATTSSGAHVFVGPPGVGKTVCLCKWLAQAVLVEGSAARVWRLDGRVANTAESLSVYCDILNTPVERSIPTTSNAQEGELLFVDLPGVNWQDQASLNALAKQLQELAFAQVHLVLNAAYETSVLLAQARAFSALPLHDLIFTHLDEESRWGKLWNVLLGTNFSVRFLSAGQNIPGEWLPGTPERLLARQFSAN